MKQLNQSMAQQAIANRMSQQKAAREQQMQLIQELNKAGAAPKDGSAPIDDDGIRMAYEKMGLLPPNVTVKVHKPDGLPWETIDQQVPDPKWRPNFMQQQQGPSMPELIQQAKSMGLNQEQAKQFVRMQTGAN